MKDKLITIIEFEDSIEANSIKTILESNDIQCFLADENLISVNPFYTSAIGRIKLQINEKYFDKAYQVLLENNYDFKQHKKTDNIKVEPCSKCNSRNVKTIRSKIPFIIFSALFLFIPIILKKRNFKCNDCHNSWIEPVNSHRIFISILLSLFVIILWASAIAEIFSFIQDYKNKSIYNLRDEIFKLQVSNKTGYDRHYELIYKVVAEYQKQNDTDEIIDFLKSQSEKIKFSGNNKTINFYILQGKLGMYIF